MITCCWRPTPESDSRSCTSSNRQGTPLMAYSLSPLRNSVRVIVTSANSVGRRPASLSIVRLTSARPSAGRLAVPAKMTSSSFDDRTVFGPWAPSTHATASTMFDLPEPLGPTTTVTPGSSSSVVVSANDLKPLRVKLFRYTSRPTVEGARRVARASLFPHPVTWAGVSTIAGVAPLIYVTNVSLDGYIEDANGRFDWTEPSDEVFGFITDLVRPVSTWLYGRRLYEAMAVWETDPSLPARRALMADFAHVW